MIDETLERAIDEAGSVKRSSPMPPNLGIPPPTRRIKGVWWGIVRKVKRGQGGRMTETAPTP